MPKLRVHIGHHFFGSGNLGDDLMLEGFLGAARPHWLKQATLTCCTPHDADSQRRRFPAIEWLPYDVANRASCIERADVWLGLGDTPFQATGGHTWFLDHLGEEAAWCRRYDKPMFYLGVGVNERATAGHPQVQALVNQAERLWTRDENSAEMLAPQAAAGKITAHADLAHVALAAASFRAVEPDTLGMVLNFEDPAQFDLERLAELVQAAHRWQLRWLAQEIRPLPGSESWLHARLPAELQARMPLRLPGYARATSAHALLASWEGLESIFTSRYHATLIAAWMGASVATFARNDKVAGAVRQLGLVAVDDPGDPVAVLRNIGEASPIERRTLLGLADTSRQACEQFFAAVTPAPLRPTTVANTALPPRRLLFLRPDAYGDLCLFEPVLRLVRDAWPQTEVAVLIRDPYQDIVPLLNTADVQWLTTVCNPYREGPADRPAALAALRDTVCAYAPDCLVAACTDQTWLESAVAAFLPDARQISFGPGLTDPVSRAALNAAMPVDWAAIYPEKIPARPEASEWEKNLSLAGELLSRPSPRWWPVARSPEPAQAQARQIVDDAGLPPGGFVACAAAGTANVQIKAWPTRNYGEILAWLEKEHGLRALLFGHVSERHRLEAVRAAARAHGGDPALWTGRDGEMPVVAALLEASRFFFGNDTGALHLAAALGRPVVSIFGGGHWPRFRPVAAREMTVVQPLPCFGCGWECDFADAPCVRTISVASVQRALEDFLAADGPAQTVFEADGLEPGARAIIEAATPRLRFLRDDGKARLRQVEELSTLLAASETDRAARLHQVEALDALLAGRGREIEELTALVRDSEADRTARLRQVEELSVLLAASETDRAARLKSVETLESLLAVSETDRAARLVSIEALTALIHAATPADAGVLDGKG